MPLPKHLFVNDESGALSDTRESDWHKRVALRGVYCRTYLTICTVSEFKATLRAGSNTWPGLYPLYFIASDGTALSYDSARKEFRNIASSIREKSSDGWRVVGCRINYEDNDLVCDRSGKKIESAYGEEPASTRNSH